MIIVVVKRIVRAVSRAFKGSLDFSRKPCIVFSCVMLWFGFVLFGLVLRQPHCAARAGLELTRLELD